MVEYDSFQNKTLSNNSYYKSTNKTQGKFKLENDLKGVKYINVIDNHMPLSKPDRADIGVENREISTEIKEGAKPTKSDDSEPSMLCAICK